ncbi:hypothetical protein GCM10011391_39470 [Pullulanibacillus camelliae]|uniref:CDP-glycerol--glycerophosphate glycerophosphotransferase n=1 Tax=Pullulanibacillus camelliae TaxID=1707096 RepID=A0A8J3E009_9BACL|nr:CDP-glycerol glycerophosphotransferase family protein [Pullulanibacillus camelliae]GGE56661.1 hypothetical protein GCM10011391_39470 [Pullulanibacillus camelliae]
MLREIVIDLYLLIFKCIFNFFKLFKLQDKVTFVVSFPQNSLPIYKELNKQHLSTDVFFLSKASCAEVLQSEIEKPVVLFETMNLVDMMRSIYHLATSKYVFIDNYFGFLAAIQFKPEVECIQLWHAAGAIKTFAFKDKSIQQRSSRAQKRFERVYNKFDKVVVGSEAMANIFMEAFHLPAEKMVRTGIPRTDFFYDVSMKQTVIKAFYQDYPELRNKKIILYAPTYRDQELEHFCLRLDIENMYEELSKDYALILKLHPAVKVSDAIDARFKGFAYDFSSYLDVNELLMITDILISDYSSIPYEFALFNKPMIFFPYDLEEYTRTRGLWGSYEDLVPGPVVFDTESIVKLIKQDAFDYNKIQEFSRKWNMYSRGNASRNLVTALFREEEAKGVQEAQN